MGKKSSNSGNELEVQNSVKTMLANIRFMSPDDPIRSLVVTSALPSEGKSTTIVELARAIAGSGKTVVLVEADMRRRSLAGRLGVRPRRGGYAVLTGQVSLNYAVVPTQTPNMFFLDMEPGIPSPSDVLSSKSFARMVANLQRTYDYVLFDTPPVGTFVDAAILSTLVDATIMVVKVGSTKRDDLTHAYTQLQKAGANVLGVCATFCEGLGSEYYYSYYVEDKRKVRKDEFTWPAAEGSGAGASGLGGAGMSGASGMRPIDLKGE